MVHATLVMCIEHSLETVVDLSNGGVTSSSRHPLGAEIEKLPFLTNEKTYITCERYTIDSVFVLNMYRKLVTLSTGNISSDDVTNVKEGEN